MALALRRIVRPIVGALAAALLVSGHLDAGGFVHSPNIVVFTPAAATPQASEQFARDVLDRAEEYRKRIALEWLGEELPPSVGQVMVNIKFSERPDSALTWAKDHPDRKFHALFLTTAPEQMPDGLLAHEMAHCVLATRFEHPHRLPPWIEEGIASRYDDAQRQATRHRIAQWFVGTGNWPRLASVLTAEKVPSDDQQAYTLCASVTDMLVERGGKKKLLEFGQQIERGGLDRALLESYGISNAAELESLWRAHMARSLETKGAKR
jgi:hypothetical protein